MTTLPIAQDVRDEAVQGSWCPKLCTFACPVTMATGDQHAVPWSFHRVVADLADGRTTPDQVDHRLDRCTGCLACRDACTFEQDVPAQVLAGRAVSPVEGPAADAALANLADGRRPDGSAAPGVRESAEADVVLLSGCQDAQADTEAAVALLEAAGRHVTVVPAQPCCGGVARDLGATDLADTLAAATSEAMAEATHGTDLTVVAIDPHCGIADVDVVPVLEVLAAHVDDLAFVPEDGTAVVVHDPCVSVRVHGVLDAPRALLRAAGVVVVEPEGAGRDTVCSGAGMSLPIVDESAAAATADRRVAMLGDGPVVTWCGRAEQRLGTSGADVSSLLQTLRRRLVAP